jgi:Tol biopolymer transport system component
VAFAASGCRDESQRNISPVASGLVFVRVVDRSTEIIRVRLSDGAERAITNTPGRAERWPYWSQSARRLVYQTGDPGDPKSSDLVLFDPQTNTESALLTTPQREERWPGWSPDGRAVVYAFRGGIPASGVAITNWRQHRDALIARAGNNDFYLRPNFSPGGSRLVVQRLSPAPEKVSNLWILSPRARPRRLTHDPAWRDSKAWFTRDGSRVVYTRRPAGDGPYDIFGIDTRGGEPVAIIHSDANDHSARPSPSRDEIVFVSDRFGSSDVFTADLGGGGTRILGRTPDTNDLAPRWSPDGELVVVTRVGRTIADFGSMTREALSKARIAVLDREGRQLFETAGAMPDWMPAWP